MIRTSLPGTRFEEHQRLIRGFTIIELLIVVGILLLLTTFTAISIDFAFEAERVGSGARQVQSMISGARDRAIRAKKPVGVRFLVDQDPDNGRMVSSMVYVGAADLWNRGNITLKRPDMEGFPATMPPGDGTADTDEVRIVDGEGTLWRVLYQRGFLGSYETDLNGDGWTAGDPLEDLNLNGVQDQVTPRIKIPGDKNGTWYRVRTHWLGLAGGEERLELVRPFRDAGTTPGDEVIAFEGTGHSTYLLELPPRVLPDAEPVTLPEGVVIDMDASVIPVEWRPIGGGHTVPCSNRMDLMFSPRGTVLGSPAGLGMLHFYISKRTDVQNCMDAVPQRRPTNGSLPPLVPADGLFATIPMQNPPPVGDRALVSLFSSTGKVSSYPLSPQDGEDTNGNGSLDPGEDTNGNGSLDGPDGYVDDPFVYARLGEVSSQ
ncbi:MAG: prepilin-type N-terminal cleavage/methylation domain-containing protein [Planctomycetota bacterium]|jgi:prepilin-type N-terminal cleavage/methylation domain-containing protein